MSRDIGVAIECMIFFENKFVRDANNYNYTLRLCFTERNEHIFSLLNCSLSNQIVIDHVQNVTAVQQVKWVTK